MSELLIANAGGRVVGSVAVRTAPVHSLAAAARGNIGWIGFAALLVAALGYLESFDNDEVNDSIKKWKDAARLLGEEQFGAALEEVIPSADEWDFDDRDAFEAFVRKLNAEINSLAEAFAANAEALTAARDGFNDAVDALIEILIPILISVIAAIALQAFPATAPIANAIGIAGMTATAAVLALTFSDIQALLAAVMTGFRGNDRHAFVSDSRPGWAAAGTDPGLQDIKIDWVKDSSFYQR